MNNSVKLSVKSARLLDEPTLLQYDRLMDEQLAPPVQLPAPVAPAPQPPTEAPEEGITSAPESLAPPSPALVSAGAPTQPKPDYSAALADAQQRAADNRFIAGTGGAAQHLIDSVAKTKGGGFFDEAMRNADQPVRDLQQKIELDKHQASQRAHDEESDPSSRVSVMAREQLKALNPRGASMLGPAFERMSAKDVSSYMGVSMKDMQLEAMLEKNRNADDVARGKLDLQESEHQRKIEEFIKTLPLEQQKAAAATLGAKASMMRALMLPEQIAASAGRGEGVGQRRAGDRILDYQKQMKELGAQITQLEQVERLAPGMTRGLAPGEAIGSDGTPVLDWTKVKNAVLKKGIGQHFSTPQEQAIRSAVMMFKAKVRHPLAGANLTDYEREYYDQAFADALLSSPEVQAAVLDMFRHTLHGSMKRLESGYEFVVEGEKPGMWQAYSQRPGAVTSKHPLFKDLEQPQAVPSAPPPAPPSQSSRPPAPPINTGTQVKEPRPFVLNKRTGQKIPVSPQEAQMFVGKSNYEVSFEP